MSDPKVDAWMPLWIGAYLADTMTLTTQQHGAYLLLLFAYWRNRGPLKDDDEDLASVVKASADEWPRLRAKLERFFSVEAGVWVHKRADEELRKAQDGRAKASEKASKAAKAKWEKAREQSASNAPSSAQAVPEQCPTPSPIQEVSNPSGSHPPAKADGKTPTVPCPYDAIVAAYHQALPALPSVRLMPVARQKAMRKAWGWVLSSSRPDGTRRATTAEEALQWFRDYFERASHNDFLMGRTPRSGEHADWKCDIDFLLTDKGMKQVIEKTVEAA